MSLKYKQELVIREVKKFVESAPLKRIPIADLMEKFSLSEDKLTKGFKELYGEKLYNYQLRICMQAAAELLRQGVMIKSVALAAGYKTTGNFARAFLKVFKRRPAEYQNEKTAQ